MVTSTMTTIVTARLESAFPPEFNASAAIRNTMNSTLCTR